jgi:integrase
MLPELERRVAKRTLSKGTLAKDRQALNRWELVTRPENWPANSPWPGLPIGYITPRATQVFLEDLFATMKSAGTARSTWNHLRNILNCAVRMRAIDTFPKPSHVPTSTKDEDEEDDLVTFYRPEQIEAAYRSLKNEVDLQVAFVLATNVGPRTHDVFVMRWSSFDLKSRRPSVSYVAKKTGKRQRVPLAPVTVEQLKRLPSFGRDEYLFPGRTNPTAEDPERSRPARRRRATINAALRSAGIDFARPFQAARATCNKRLEDWRTGVGQFVLGHALTLNARHYYEPSDLIFEAVNAVEQPACFSEF